MKTFDKQEYEALAGSPRQACQLLNVGNSYLYTLIGKGELETYVEGGKRMITMRSIHDRIRRLVVASKGAVAKATPNPKPRKVRRR